MAFNALAGSWKVEPVPEYPPESQVRAWSGRLSTGSSFCTGFRKPGALLRMKLPGRSGDYPTGVSGKRFISLVGREDEKLLVDPPSPGRRPWPLTNWKNHWSGQAFLLWKDALNLMPKISLAAKGDPSNSSRPCSGKQGPITIRGPASMTATPAQP